jgi:hypothetical protein
MRVVCQLPMKGKVVLLTLSRWQKLGILLSILWAIGAAIYQRSVDVGRAQNSVKYAYKSCLDGYKDLARCEQEREKYTAVFMKESWGNVALLAFGPIPFAWIVAYVLSGLGLAQRLFWLNIATGTVMPAIVGLIVPQGLLAQGELAESYELFDVLTVTPLFAAPFVLVAFSSRSALRRTPDGKTVFEAVGAYAGGTLSIAWLSFWFFSSGIGALGILVGFYVPFLVGYGASWIGVCLGWVVYRIRSRFTHQPHSQR